MSRHLMLHAISSDGLDTSGRGYPRPQLRRREWYSLNGDWEFAIDRDGLADHPSAVEWRSTIQVPFSPETPASGIGDTGFYRQCWYRRQVRIPPLAAGQRLCLRLAAVERCHCRSEGCGGRHQPVG